MEVRMIFGILSILIPTFEAAINKDIFTRDSRYEDSLPVNVIVWNLSVRNRLECAMFCFHKPDCIAFFHNHLQCYGYSRRMHDCVSTAKDVSGMTYYELKGLYGNVAQGKPASQSSTWTLNTGTYGAEQAVDGRRWPVAFAPDDSCTNTNITSEVWWQVNLLKDYVIQTVSVLTRKDSANVLTTAYMSTGIGNTSAGPFHECEKFADGWISEFKDFRCDPAIRGQFVKISKYLHPEWTLNICEVEVYASEILIPES